MRDDRPINVQGWQPENYGHEYFGPVPLSKALAMSLNTVSVRLTLEMTPARGRAHRASARHRLEARAQRLDRARHVGSVAAGAGRRLRALRQWRLCGHAARDRPHHDAQRQAALRIPARRSSAASSTPRYVAMMNCDDGADAHHRHRAQGVAAGLDRRRQDRHVARISATPGSSATRRISSPASGSAMTTARRPSTSPAAACRSKSGAASCATRTRACRSPRCRPSNGGGLIAACSAVADRRRIAPAKTDGAPPRPPAIDSDHAAMRRARSGGLDGWLLDNLFGRR